MITEASMTVGDETLDRKNNESKSMLQVYNSKTNLLTNSVESPRKGTLKLPKKGKRRMRKLEAEWKNSDEQT